MSEDKKELGIGEVKIINLLDELSLNSEELVEDISAFSVPYGTTAGCTESCGSSTLCC